MIKIRVETFHNQNYKLLGLRQQKIFDNRDQALAYYDYLVSLCEDPVWEAAE